MTKRRNTVFNRADCPYGCGTPLDPKLRWQATSCKGCGRPLYPVGAVVDAAGRELWPPAGVPRPVMPVPADSEFWYVVGEQEAAERLAILGEIPRKSEEGCINGAATILGLGAIAVADFVWRMVRAVLRR